MVTPQDFIHSLESQNYMLNKQCHVKGLLKRFHLKGNTIGLRPQTQFLQNYILNKQYHGKVFLKRFHLNGNTIGLRPQTQKLILYIYDEKELLKGFHLNGHTIGFHPQTQKLVLHTKCKEPCESIVEEVSFEESHQKFWSTESKVRITSQDSLYIFIL